MAPGAQERKYERLGKHVTQEAGHVADGHVALLARTRPVAETQPTPNQLAMPSARHVTALCALLEAIVAR